MREMRRPHPAGFYAAVPGMILDGLGELFDNLRLDFPHLRGALTLVLDTVADPESGLDAPLEDPFAVLGGGVTRRHAAPDPASYGPCGQRARKECQHGPD